jgi:hypothetical protein
VFARFDRPNDGVVRRVEMLCGVLVLRGIAAPHVAALQAKAQVDPGIACFEAFLAAVRRRLYFVDGIEMSAVYGHSPWITAMGAGLQGFLPPVDDRAK